MCYSKNGGTSYTTYFYGINAQGDVEKLFRMTKNADTGEYEETVYGRYVYDVWGNVTAATAAGAAAGTTTLVYRNPIRYRGYYYDTETGFYYLQSRYYDPVCHRFINADGYASTGQGFTGTNMFVYCLNDPVMLIDEAGEAALTLAQLRRIHNEVADRVANSLGGVREVYIKKVEIDGDKITIKRGFLDVYIPASNTFYEIKSVHVV